MTKILVSDALSDEGLGILRASGFQVDHKPDISAADLETEIAHYDALVIRSRTTVTAKVIENGKKLRVVGRAGVGLDNVDVPAATKHGVIVMNTPDGNTISTAEHSFAMLTSLARSIPQAHGSMRDGKWDKKKYTGVELYNKTLGICGLGRIGTQVARRALAYGMHVIAYDPYTTAETMMKHGITRAELDDIWAKADFITVHAPLTDQTRNMIGAPQIAKMKKGVRIVNCARGGIVNEEALIEGLKSGHVAGAALDVFEQEPLPGDHPLRAFDNVILTPHLGAATSEAQEGVAKDVAEQIIDVLQGRTIRNAVNAPSVDPALLEQMRPFIDLAQDLGKFLIQFGGQSVKRLKVYYSGTVLDYPTAPITTAAVMGFLAPISSHTINFVNAGPIAEEMGIEVIEERSTHLYSFANLVTLEATTEDGSQNFVGGTMFTANTPRIVNVNDKFFDVVPEGNLIVIENKDVPGIIGNVGTLLGSSNINIAQMTWGRTKPGEDAITVINVDQDVSKALLDQIASLPNILSARLIRL